jgi:hypothetical protein
MAGNNFKGQVKEWEDDVVKTVSPETVHKKLIELHGKELIKAVIGAANLGTGPNGKKYPAYSKEYAKLKKEKGRGTLGNWLRGLGDGKRMLAEKNFSWEIKGKGLYLVWTAPDKQTGEYAEAHQEGLGNMPERRWLHFEATRTIKAVEKAYQDTFDAVIEDFNNNRV